jgi:large repetitive protein
VATITVGGKIHIVGVGKVTIAAFQVGDKTYLPSDTVLQAFTVTPAPLTIMADDQSRAYRAADPPFTVTYTGFVNGDNISKLNPGPVVKTTANVASTIGKYPLQPSGALDPNYSITYQAGTLTIKAASRTLTFGTLPAKIYTDPDFDPGAILSSGDPVVYSSANTTVATIVQGKIHITGTGNSDITATAPADSNYLAVSSVMQTLTVNKAPQTITFHVIPVQQKSAGVYITGATASSGLPVTLGSSDIAIAAIDGLSVKLLELGTTEITATQAGNNDYLPATAVVRTLKIEGTGGALVLVHRIVSPNGDGINDALLIEGIKDYPDNTLTVVNRNGVKVFQISNYDNSSHVFTGHGINGDLLPQGTYFFQLDYQVRGEVKRMTDYFVIKL